MYNACISLACFGQLVVLHFVLVCLHGSFNNSLGMVGRREAALYFTTKKKIPKKAPWGELPGSNFEEDEAPLYVRIMDLSVR